MGEAKQDKPAITAADVPTAVADAIIVGRIKAATNANLGAAAQKINAWYGIGEGDRQDSEIAIGDALGVNRDAFGAVKA